jgi:hypothetical protein
LACFLTRAKAGISIDIRSAIIAMTTSSSTKVKAFRRSGFGLSKDFLPAPLNCL